jgi:hypothetical protein
VVIQGFDSKAAEEAAARSETTLSKKSFVSTLNSDRDLVLKALVLDFLCQIAEWLEPIIQFLLLYNFMGDTQTNPSTLSSHLRNSLLFDVRSVTLPPGHVI